MEEQRIGMMYMNLVRRWLLGLWDATLGDSARRSTILLWGTVSALILVPLIGWQMHKHAQFHTLKSEMSGDAPPASLLRPGGMDPVLLRRERTGTGPELLSATLLPGLGMSVLQITAYVPGHGEVSLLDAPSLPAMADGTAPPPAGWNDTRGAIELPWAGGLSGQVSPIGTSVSTTWHGQTIQVQTERQLHNGVAEGGLLASVGADDVKTAGGAGSQTEATGTFRNLSFGDHWLSKTDVVVKTALGGQALELNVRATNTGSTAEPMGIGWHPRLSILSHMRDDAAIRMPAGSQVEIADRARNLPSGKLLPGAGAAAAYTQRLTPVGLEPLDLQVAGLKTASGQAGPTIEFVDPASGYGVRLTALSSAIQVASMAVPSNAGFASLGLQTNLDDPTGKEWAGLQATGPSGSGEPIATLNPGQTLEWKVRVELFGVPARPTR